MVNYQEKSETTSHENHQTFLGDAGDWIQDLIHAKHALYHWATSPLSESLFCFCRYTNTINPVVGNYQDKSEIILHESHRTVLGDATQDLIHAKDALYHWATSPVKKSPFCFCRFTNTTNPVVVNYQEKSEIISHENHRTFLGDAGDWIQDLIHAKHALYHCATSPLNENLFCFCRFKNTINPVVGNYQDISVIILLKFAWKS